MKSLNPSKIDETTDDEDNSSLADTNGDYSISDEEEMQYDDINSEEQSELEDVESSDISDDDVPQETNTLESKSLIKLAMKSETEKLKLQKQMEKARRSKKTVTDKEEPRDDCIAEFEEKILNYLIDDVGQDYLPGSEDELNSEQESNDNNTDEEMDDDFENDDDLENDDDQSDQEEIETDETNEDSADCQNEIVLPKKYKVIKKTKQLKDLQKMQIKICKINALKFQKEKIFNSKRIKRCSKSQLLKLKNLKKLR